MLFDSLLPFLNIAGYVAKFTLLDQNPLLKVVGVVENCDKYWLNWNFEGLNHYIYGQSLAVRKLAESLRTEAFKPRLLSLHGGPGTGKTHTIQVLRDRIYQQKSDSHFFKYYSGSEFEFSDDLASQLRLRTEIGLAIRFCSSPIIVFDEADRFPPGFLDSLVIPHMGPNMRKSPVPTFIFISNIGAEEIIFGFERGLDKFSEYESLLQTFIPKRNDFFSTSKLVQDRLLNYVPFLPLEEDSVEKCVEKSLDYSSQQQIRKVMEQIDFKKGLLVSKKYSQFGCKNIENHIVTLRHREEL